MSTDPISIFRKTWATYQKVIGNNLMFHREISAAVCQHLAARAKPLRMVELGCGDASHISTLLKPEELAEYCGCDLSQFALDEARNKLKPFGAAIRLCCTDMLDVLEKAPANHYDIVYSSYALHHLPLEGKQKVFTECRRILGDNGSLILVDVMRNEGQMRQEYLYSYNRIVRTQWVALTPDERNQVQEHIRNCDFPEPASTLEQLARNAGFTTCRRLEKQNWHEAWSYQASSGNAGAQR